MTRTERVARARELLADAYNQRGWPTSAAQIRRGESTGEEDSAPMLAVIAALTAIDEERDALREALTAFADEYLPSGIRETPEWQAVLNQARSLSSVSREEN